jgi:hypothetical protein
MLARTLMLSIALTGCAITDGGTDEDASADAIESGNAWYTISAAHGLGAATLQVANGYKVKCPNGHSANTCDVTALVVPADCGFECTDGLLGLQGDSLVRGSFAGTTFVISAGFDTWSRNLGTYSIYRLAGAATCTQAPCPTGITAQKINIKTQPTAVSSVDFSRSFDPNYVLDITRGDDQIASSAGLLATGHIVSHVFRVDRVFRAETGRSACDPQQVAREHAYSGEEELRQFRTESEAERFIPPPVADEPSPNHWLVRSAETPALVTFTSGINDLWATRFTVATSDCAITTIAEH